MAAGKVIKISTAALYDRFINSGTVPLTFSVSVLFGKVFTSGNLTECSAPNIQ
jgi:hypothetical protein